MRRSFSLALCVFLASLGCSRQPSDTVALLEQGSPDACTATDVLKILNQAGFPDPKFWGVGKRTPDGLTLRQISFLLKDVSVQEVKKEERAMVCDANVYLSKDGQTPLAANSQPFTYEIRPVIGEGRKVLVTARTDELSEWTRQLLQNMGAI